MSKMTKPCDFTQEELMGALYYNPETGEFSKSLHIDGRGYYQIYIFGKLRLAHRLAWMYVTGEWPRYIIDHKNNNKSDSRFDNLRKATHSQNVCNAKRRKSSAPYKGIQKHYNRWRAQISFEGKSHFIGLFLTPEEAHSAYCLEAERLHGEFARTS